MYQGFNLSETLSTYNLVTTDDFGTHEHRDLLMLHTFETNAICIFRVWFLVTLDDLNNRVLLLLI